MDWDALVEEAKAIAQGKGRVWVPGYTRADGTHVDGYYRFSGRVGATAFRPEDDYDGFYDTDKARAFEARLEGIAKKYGVTLTKVERVDGFWEGDLEPSWSIEAHDGEEGVALFSEQIRAEENQDAVLNFDFDDDGGSVLYELDGQRDWAKLLHEHGIQGATIHDGRVEIIGDDTLAAKIERLAKDARSEVSFTRGNFNLVSSAE